MVFVLAASALPQSETGVYLAVGEHQQNYYFFVQNAVSFLLIPIGFMEIFSSFFLAICWVSLLRYADLFEQQLSILDVLTSEIVFGVATMVRLFSVMILFFTLAFSAIFLIMVRLFRAFFLVVTLAFPAKGVRLIYLS